jgi:DNA polymerase III subunit alpha
VLADDQIVLVRGTVDHDDRGSCVKVADVEAYDPSETEIEQAREAALKAAEPPPPLRLRLDAGALPANVLEDLKRLLADYPGESDVVLDLHTASGARRLKLGEGYRVAARNAALQAELKRLLPAGPEAAPVPA